MHIPRCAELEALTPWHILNGDPPQYTGVLEHWVLAFVQRNSPCLALLSPDLFTHTGLLSPASESFKDSFGSSFSSGKCNFLTLLMSRRFLLKIRSFWWENVTILVIWLPSSPPPMFVAVFNWFFFFSFDVRDFPELQCLDVYML